MTDLQVTEKYNKIIEDQKKFNADEMLSFAVALETLGLFIDHQAGLSIPDVNVKKFKKCHKFLTDSYNNNFNWD